MYCSISDAPLHAFHEVLLRNSCWELSLRAATRFPQGPGELLVDAVSLFPAGNVRDGAQNPWPFRKDLLDMLQALNMRWVLFQVGGFSALCADSWTSIGHAWHTTRLQMQDVFQDPWVQGMSASYKMFED